MCKTALFPISCIRTDFPFGFKQEKCNYTRKGRTLLHDSLQGFSTSTLLYLMKHPIISESTEYNDNRISLYSGQQGKCFITDEPLQVGNMEAHHKKPRSHGGTDEYKNLCFIKADVHVLVHATQQETIIKYLEKLRLSPIALQKLNKLRTLVGNCIINENK